MLDVQTRNEALLDLFLTNQEYLLFDTLVSDSFGYSDHNITELGIPLDKLKILEEKTWASPELIWRNFVGRHYGG